MTQHNRQPTRHDLVDEFFDRVEAGDRRWLHEFELALGRVRDE